MNKRITAIQSALTLALFNTPVTFSQSLCMGWYQIDFELGDCVENIFVDTISNPDNIWQVGLPFKSEFNATSFDSEKGIVTDLAMTYPVNDTSAFYWSHPLTGFDVDLLWGGLEYYVDSDSSNDYGLFEFSPDNGISWFDLINNPFFDDKIDWWNKPVLTGSSSGWVATSFNFDPWDSFSFASTYNITVDDTMQFRFTFISDSLAETKDGLAFRNFEISDFWWGIEESQVHSLSIAPNPATNVVRFIDLPTGLNHVYIYDICGRLILQTEIIDNALNVSELPPGIYQINLFSADKAYIARLVK